MALRPAPQRRRVRLLRPRRGGRRRVEVSSGGGLELRPAIRGRAPPFRTDVGLRRWLRPERRRVAGLRRRTGAKNEILDALSRLVDKSLVAAPNAGRYARFTQLQTLWQYGRDRLNDSGEVDALCARHAAYYRQMAEGPTRACEAPRGRCGGNASPQTWRTSGQRSTGSSHDVMPMGAMSLASGMAWLWFITSDYVEGALWLGDALEAKGPRRATRSARPHVRGRRQHTAVA